MSKFAQIDGAILEAIAGGRDTFTALQTRALMDQAAQLSKPDRYGDRPAWRVLDRRLQALRKAGRIQFVKGRWALTAQRAAEGDA